MELYYRVVKILTYKINEKISKLMFLTKINSVGFFHKTFIAK